MSIQSINDALCIGCGICVNACPMDVIRLDKTKRKAVIKYVEDCMCCSWCEVECPQKAIYVSPEKYSPLMVSWR
jgi:NAD-dependent dihydropyrimidine dehydrogenase PreA subunit